MIIRIFGNMMAFIQWGWLSNSRWSKVDLTLDDWQNVCDEIGISGVGSFYKWMDITYGKWCWSLGQGNDWGIMFYRSEDAMAFKLRWL